MGIVFDIQKFSVNDGPGIRTTVFLKGCNLRCLWCHNPESFEIKPQLSFESSKCIGCKKCLEVCPENVHEFVEGKHIVHFNQCIECGKCIDVCIPNALKIIGKEMSVEKVICEILSDKIFYDSSGGGVTFSGGEPTLQFDFLLKLIEECKRQNIHVCVDTNGIMEQCKREQLGKVCDLFLVDYKATDTNIHRKLVGDGNSEVIKTLEYFNSINKPVILRCPVIPGLNDSKDHFESIKQIKKKYKNIQSVDLMAYHATGRKKWVDIGLDYSLNYLESVKPDQKKIWEELIK